MHSTRAPLPWHERFHPSAALGRGWRVENEHKWNSSGFHESWKNPSNCLNSTSVWVFSRKLECILRALPWEKVNMSYIKRFIKTNIQQFIYKNKIYKKIVCYSLVIWFLLHTHTGTSSIQHLPGYADPEDLWGVTACVQYWRNPHRVEKESAKGTVKIKSSAPISAKLFHAAALELIWAKDRACLRQRAS